MRIKQKLEKQLEARETFEKAKEFLK